MILSTDGVARLASGAFVCFESAGACACAEAAGATADTMHAIRTIAHSRKHLDTLRCEIMFVPARLCLQIRSGLPGPGCPIDAGFPFCPRKKRKKALQKVSDFPKACSRRRLYRCGRAAKVAADRYARQSCAVSRSFHSATTTFVEFTGAANRLRLREEAAASRRRFEKCCCSLRLRWD